VQPLTMMDMGMRHDMGGMNMPTHAAGDKSGHDMPDMDMGEDTNKGTDIGTGMGEGMDMSGIIEAHHPYPTERGVSNSMLPDMVSTRLDDPGVGLRENGRVVLTYADLHSLSEPPDNRPPTRAIELHLTGNMDRYMWSFNGVAFTDARPIVLQYGERVRFVLVNDTMMTHPIHLHGLWSDLESPDGRFQVRKHTISLNPAQRITYRVSADTRGNWAYHCHLLYHMEAGMFRAVVVA
jgi:FtsP/CotA-like multicopper oxidase with cupredoxin domain